MRVIRYLRLVKITMPRVTDVRSSIHDGLPTAIFHRGYRSLFDFHNGDTRVQDMCVSEPVFIASSLATAQTVFASIVHVEPVKDEYKVNDKLEHGVTRKKGRRHGSS